MTLAQPSWPDLNPKAWLQVVVAVREAILHPRGRAGGGAGPSEHSEHSARLERLRRMQHPDEPNKVGELNEHHAWLERLAAMRITSAESAAPPLGAGDMAGDDLRQMLTEALGEEVHRAMLTELLVQKAAEAQPAS